MEAEKCTFPVRKEIPMQNEILTQNLKIIIIWYGNHNYLSGADFGRREDGGGWGGGLGGR